MLPVYNEIIDLTDKVCREHLNDEYAVLAREMTAKLARKRPSPLLRGTLPIWACAVVYTIGQINFLFDKKNMPYMTTGDLCAAFGTKQRTVSERSHLIMEMLQTMLFDPQWTLPSRMNDNPFIWRFNVNGIIVDMRYVPRELQEEAFERGLIPYIPGDRVECRSETQPAPQADRKKPSKPVKEPDDQGPTLFDFEP